LFGFEPILVLLWRLVPTCLFGSLTLVRLFYRTIFLSWDGYLFTFPPANLAIAAFCLYFYSGVNSLFFIYTPWADLTDELSLLPALLFLGFIMGSFCLRCDETTGLTGGLNSFVFLCAEGVPPTLIFGVVLNKLFLFLFADKSDVFLSKFILTRFPEAPDLDDV